MAPTSAPPVSAAPTPPAPPPAAAQASATTTTTTNDAKSDEETPKLRLGHYSSPDGLFGFVLDRTATPPRAKIDGKPAVLELAVRRDGSERVQLLSAKGELMLLVDKWGSVSMISGANPVRLRRDADARALADVTTPETSDTLLREAEGKAKEVCGGAAIKYELEGKPSARGTFHTVQRTLRTLESVCRDAAGKEAVKKKVQRVRIGQATATKVTLTNATLGVTGDLEGESLGPNVEDIQPVLEGKL